MLCKSTVYRTSPIRTLLGQNYHYPDWLGILNLGVRWHSQDEQVTWTQHALGTSARGTGACSSYQIFGEIIHYEIVSEAVYGHKYHSFSLACMLASRPYKTNCMLIIGL